MFAFTADPETILTAFRSVDVLVDECRLHVSNNGITATAVDQANVGMVDVTIDAAAFESFEGDAYLLGFPVSRFTDAVETLSRSDELIYGRLDEETRALELESDGLSFTLSLIDANSVRREPDLPDLTLPTNVTMNGAQLQRIITASNMVSDHVALGSQENVDEFYGFAKGDADEVKITLGDNDYESAVIGDAHSLFSLDYLTDMVKTIPRDAFVTVQVGDEFPLIAEYGDENSGFSIKYVLAPRIQSH